jgi:multiple sugar transport system permease protein
VWAVAGFFVVPLVLMVAGSLATPGLPPPAGGVDLTPDAPRWQNYRDVLTLLPLGVQLGNSLLVVAVAVPVSVLVASAAGFALAVAGTRGRRLLIVVSLLAVAIPPASLWIPRVVLLERAGATGQPLEVTYTALLGTSPLFVLLFALAYLRIPSSQYELARVEGLSPIRIWTVAIPQTRAVTLAVAALTFVAHWGNVMEPLLLLTRPESQTAAVGLRVLASMEPTFYPLLLAGAVLVTTPSLLAFVLLQRQVFESVALPGGARP